MADKMPWVKVSTGIFECEKIIYIEAMERGPEIVLLWIKLLVLCGKANNGGILQINGRIPHTISTLASTMHCGRELMQAAMDTFLALGMVEDIDGVLTVPGWEEYQSEDKLAGYRLKEAERKRNWRERQKAKISMSGTCPGQCPGQETGQSPDASAECPPPVPGVEEDKDEDKDIEVDIREPSGPPSERVDYQHIVDLYNQYCQSLPRCTRLSDARRKAIKARLNGGYTMGDFEAMFKAAGQSSFLAGKNDRNWTASFDWLIKDGNMAKVLDGAYQDRGNGGKPSGPHYDYSNTEGSF